MVKRSVWLVLILALGLSVAAGAGQPAGKISGTVRDAQGQILPNVKLQLRNVDSGQLVATTRAGADGTYEFNGINPGNYIVEIVDDDGRVIGLSPATALAASA